MILIQPPEHHDHGRISDKPKPTSRVKGGVCGRSKEKSRAPCVHGAPLEEREIFIIYSKTHFDMEKIGVCPIKTVDADKKTICSHSVYAQLCAKIVDNRVGITTYTRYSTCPVCLWALRFDSTGIIFLPESRDCDTQYLAMNPKTDGILAWRAGRSKILLEET